MNRNPREQETWPMGLAARLEPVCDRFERAWLAARGDDARTQRPSLEDFLPQVQEPDRPALLRQLLLLELEYRAEQGEPPTAEEYRRRLPEHVGVIDAVFQEIAEPEFARLPSDQPPPDYAASIDAVFREAHSPELLSKPAPLQRAGRYELEERLARGGMGEIFRARDPDLNRVLAVKVLQAKYHGLPEFERRFRREAQITGQLQHPGIPAVHEIGALPDGRPFYAMKLIQGRNLADLLKERPNPGQDADLAPQPDLPRFLGIFVQVCQTLAYVHFRGVMHRDLKPSNVMVGAFGEVQIMDWGLAKDTSQESGERAQESGSVLTPAPSLRTPETQAGAVLGTPAYMAPEQARGEVELLDQRCDVFGLGAILCVILTGQPPQRDGDPEEIQQRARKGDLTDAFARLDACAADPELIGLARRCLAANRQARFHHAGEVAQALGNYQAGVQQRVREAERARAAAEAGATARADEERRGRRVSLALAVAVLLLVAAVGGGAWWYQAAQAAREAEQAQRDAELERQVNSDLTELEASRGLQRWDRVWEALERADGRLTGTTDEELKARVRQVRESLQEERRRWEAFCAEVAAQRRTR